MSRSSSPAGIHPFIFSCAFLLLLLIVIGALWWPRGLNIPPTEDDWNNYVLLDQQPAGTFLPPITDPSRPLIMLWWRVAYALSPNSMLAVNWMTALAMLVRAVSLYSIVMFLTRHRAWAVAAACLVVILPLDFGLYEKGTFHIYMATSLYFAAAALFFTLSRRFRGWMLPILWLMLGLICTMYESAYPMIALTPFLLLIKDRRLTRANVLLSLAWWAVPAVCALFFFLPSITASASYQRNLLSQDLSILGLIKTAFDTYVYVIVKVWYATLRQETGQFLLVRLIVGLGVGVFVGWLLRKSAAPKLHPFWLLLCSLLMIGAGFAMYLPTSLLSGGTGTRVHFLTAGGAALFIITLCWMISRLVRVPMVFAGLIGVCVVVSLGGTMSLIRAGTLAHADGQGYFLSSLTQQAPRFEPQTTLVFLFSPDVDNPFPDFQVGYLHNGVTYLYRDYSLTTHVCYDNDCAPSLWQSLDPAHTIVFRVTPDLSLTRLETVPAFSSEYQPTQLIDFTAPLPPRLKTLYSQ